MLLKVIKAFNGKAEGKVLKPGDNVVTADLERVNTLVSRGFCVIASVDAPKPEEETVKDSEPASETEAAPESEAAPKTKGRKSQPKEE